MLTSRDIFTPRKPPNPRSATYGLVVRASAILNSRVGRHEYAKVVNRIHRKVGREVQLRRDHKASLLFALYESGPEAKIASNKTLNQAK